MKARWAMLLLLALGLGIIGGPLLFGAFAKPNPKYLVDAKNGVQRRVLSKHEDTNKLLRMIEEAKQPVVNPGISYVHSDDYKNGYVLKINGILPESPAARADIRGGDILISVNGVVPKFDGQDIYNYLGGGNPVNQNTTFVIERDGRRTTISAKNVLLRGDTSKERAALLKRAKAEGKDRLARLEQKAEVAYQWFASKKAARDRHFWLHKSVDEFLKEDVAFTRWYIDQLDTYYDITNLAYPAHSE